jgi:hypothetical protein
MRKTFNLILEMPETELGLECRLFYCHSSTFLSFPQQPLLTPTPENVKQQRKVNKIVKGVVAVYKY